LNGVEFYAKQIRHRLFEKVAFFHFIKQSYKLLLVHSCSLKEDKAQENKFFIVKMCFISINGPLREN